MVNCLTQKIELNQLIPAIRIELVKLLEKHSLNDAEIAKKLGITKAAVSQYKHKKRGKTIDFPKNIQKDIKDSAELILKGKLADEQTNKLISKIKNSGYICKICKECKCK